jgi:solute carrier family 6 amino acid transporter-like protein 5/7/9/14
MGQCCLSSFFVLLLIRGLTLDGAMDGIKHFIVPEWSKLLDLKVLCFI